MAGENDVKQTDTIDTRQTTNAVPLSNIPSQTAKRTSLISPQIIASPEKLKKFIELKRAQKLDKENKRKAYYLANKDKKLEAFNNFWKKQNEKNAAKYKIEETTFNINENESVKTHVIHMSDFYNKWYNRLEDGDIRQPVRSGLYAIFRDAGFKTNNAVPFKLVDDTRRRVSEMYSQSPEFDARNANMHEMSVVFFKDSYDAIERVNLSPEKRIVTAQKIANLMLKTYSPIPFVKGELDQYADNYVVKNKAVLKDLLQRLNVQNIDKVMEDVNAELARGVENEQPKVEVNSIPNVNNVQENVVSAQPQEPPKEEPPKEEPPKEEPPKEEPPKEEPTPTVEQKETYKIEETTFNINENESVKSHVVDMPDFYKKWYNRLQDDEITQPVRSGLYAIFRDAGFKTNNAVPFKLVDDTHRRVSEMYGRTPEFNGRSANMHEMATMFFRDSYDAIERARLSPEKRIVTAQKIANLMLKTYSHIPFVKGELDQYADNYVVNNKVVLKDQLQRLDIQNIDKVMEDVDVALTAVPETEQQKIEDVANSAPNVNETQENVVTTSQQEITKEEPPKEEPPKEEPPKEEPPKEEPPKEEPPKEEPPKEEPPKEEPPKEELPKEEPPKEEPPKEEPPKEEPPKEEPPKEEPPKEEPPKEEPPKEEPPKEELPKEEPPKEEPSKVGPEWINMTKFDEKLAVLMQNKALPSNTKKYISDILQEAGVETGGADDPLEYINILNDAYDQKKFPRDVTQSMNDITKQIFISTYNALTKKGISPNNKIETTQKISDVLLKFYSPATLVEPLKKYTQNYVTGDKDILKECLTSLNLPEKEIKAMMEDNKEKQVENPVPQVKPEENNKEKPVENPVPQVKPEENIAPKTIDENARVSVFTEKLKTFGNMYKVDINSNNIAFDINDAWTLMKSGDKQKVENGQKILGELFKNILKPTFESEKKISYEEHRLPDYSEITKSANELLRSAMFAFTDLYHDPKSQSLFNPTAFGGLNETEISALTKVDGLWSMDQRSDEAWKIQSQESKDIAGQWLKEDKPYEKMINEMSALLDADKKGIIERKDVFKKLAAAEWLLVNNEKMMIENPEDPLNPIPNWGNRYWKSITKTREALGISKHISMRDLIQGNYAEAAKAVNSVEFNKTQIKEGVLDPQARSKCDSMDIQREQFATQCASYRLTGAKEEKTVDDLLTVENRVKITVQSENQYEIMKSEAKQFNFVIDKTMSFELTASNQAAK